MQFEAVQSRHFHVEQDASRLFDTRRTIQQVLRRRIGFDFVARLFQAPFDRGSKRGVVVYHVNNARHFPS